MLFTAITDQTGVHTVEIHFPDAGYSDRLGPSGKFVENSSKIYCLEITGYRIKYGTVLWLLELSNQAWSKGLDAVTYRK
jgi:hypothetical protein